MGNDIRISVIPMTELTVTLPDALAKDAAQEGLLTAEAGSQMLREEIRRRSVAELFGPMDHMAAAPGEPMSEDEIQAQIDAVRTSACATSSPGSASPSSQPSTPCSLSPESHQAPRTATPAGRIARTSDVS